jgi:hypothetical protein
MSAMTPQEGGLGRELAALGGELAWPATPSIAAQVSLAIASTPTSGSAPRPMRARWGWRPARRALVLGLLAVILVVGVAVGIGFALGGLRLHFGGPPPGSPLPPSVVAARGFGARTDMATAISRLGGVMVPDASVLGDPDHVYYHQQTQAVALAWGTRPGLPADPRSGLGIVITEFRADITPGTFEKVLHEDALLERTSVGGRPAYWLAGGEHFFFFRGPDGEAVPTSIRMVGTTLMWEDAGLTLRIEGAPTMQDALRIADSMAMRTEP